VCEPLRAEFIEKAEFIEILTGNFDGSRQNQCKWAEFLQRF